jgi:hypothetical protein
VPCSDMIRNSLHRLANDLQAAYHRILFLNIRGECVEIQALGVDPKERDGIEYLAKEGSRCLDS